jgi:hypothetical protein
LATGRGARARHISNGRRFYLELAHIPHAIASSTNSPPISPLALGVLSPSWVSCVVCVACLSGELTSLAALARSTTGDERKFSGEDDGFAADLLGVPLLLDGGAAASLCSWAAEASRGLLAAALRWDERRGVEDLELRWRRWPGEDMIRMLFASQLCG